MEVVRRFLRLQAVQERQAVQGCSSTSPSGGLPRLPKGVIGVSRVRTSALETTTSSQITLKRKCQCRARQKEFLLEVKPRGDPELFQIHPLQMRVETR